MSETMSACARCGLAANREDLCDVCGRHGRCHRGQRHEFWCATFTRARLQLERIIPWEQSTDDRRCTACKALLPHDLFPQDGSVCRLCGRAQPPATCQFPDCAAPATCAVTWYDHPSAPHRVALCERHRWYPAHIVHTEPPVPLRQEAQA